MTAGTFSQIHIQVVFAVRRRQPLIDPGWEEELYKYIATIIKSQNAKPIVINGVSDHIHILLGIKPSMKISEIVKVIKTGSTNFINDVLRRDGNFAWQDGYGVFSYSVLELPKIIRYIEQQKEHHKKNDYKNEYRSLMETHQITFDERYLFDS